MTIIEQNIQTTQKIDTDDIKTAIKAWKPPTRGLKSATEGGLPSVQIGDDIVIEYPAIWRSSAIGEIVSMNVNGDFFILEHGATSHVGSNFFKGLERGIKFWKYDHKVMRIAREEAVSVKVGRMGGGRTGTEDESKEKPVKIHQESPEVTDEAPKRKRGRPRKNPLPTE